MGSCHIAHDCKIGNNNIFANNTLLAGHVVVEVSPLFILHGLTSLYNVISQIFYLIRI
jgi:acyl-[acyl carrier protein]--UDP-N-acetylglucosamine O-acyltransferase